MLNKSMMGAMMKQAQKMQENLKKTQEEVANLQVSGESGGGMVKVNINGKQQLIKLEIDDSLMDDKEMLEDLICAAVNLAFEKLQEESKQKMASATGGVDLPPGFNLPF